MTCPYLDGFEFGYQPTPADIVEGHLHRRCGACRRVVPNSDGRRIPLPQNGFRLRGERRCRWYCVVTAEMCFLFGSRNDCVVGERGLEVAKVTGQAIPHCGHILV
jgi:hypothetical protein